MALPPAQLIDTWVTQLAFTEDPEFDPTESSKVSYIVEPHVKIADPVAAEGGGITSLVTLSVDVSFARNEEGDEGPLPFELTITVDGIFRWEPDVAPPEVQLASAWLEYNGMYLLWPYVRAHIAAVTALSRLPTLTIYTMNTPNPPVIPPADDDEIVEHPVVEPASEPEPSSE
jgi:hypothetical protein